MYIIFTFIFLKSTSDWKNYKSKHKVLGSCVMINIVCHSVLIV